MKSAIKSKCTECVGSNMDEHWGPGIRLSLGLEISI